MHAVRNLDMQRDDRSRPENECSAENDIPESRKARADGMAKGPALETSNLETNEKLRMLRGEVRFSRTLAELKNDR
jgi:hypothetical protein